MARPISDRIQAVRRTLIARIQNNAHQPGDRFLSNRAIADQFAISYQTADRIVRELVNDGLLIRRSAAGTFIPGEASPLIGAILLFDKRAKRKASFGARLLLNLSDALDRLRVDWRVRWIDPEASLANLRLPSDRLPVLWNLPALLTPILDQKRRALLLNDRAPSGVGATLVDSVEVDDFSGGACAAQVLSDRATTIALNRAPSTLEEEGMVGGGLHRAGMIEDPINLAHMVSSAGLKTLNFQSNLARHHTPPSRGGEILPPPVRGRAGVGGGLVNAGMIEDPINLAQTVSSAGLQTLHFHSDLARHHTPPSRGEEEDKRFAIVTGPRDDPRSRLRVEGFLSRSNAVLIESGGWYYEHAQPIAQRAIDAGRDGIFCCNDRLAHALIDHCKKVNHIPPPIVGFDNAPIAEEMGLTTIAIPWAELTAATAALIHARLRDHRSTASHRVFAPQPILRWSRPT